MPFPTTRRPIGRMVPWIITLPNDLYPFGRVVAFRNHGGSAEQWIKEGKNVSEWPRLSRREFHSTLDNEQRRSYPVMTNSTKRIGLVGCGVIGGRIAERAIERGFAKIDFVCDMDLEKAREAAPGAEVFPNLSDVAARQVDLVVEAANADVMREIAIDVLGERDFMPFTMTALADDDFREAVRVQCRKAGTRLFIPHGGVLGLDGIYDGRTVIEELTIKTTKHPRNLGLDESTSGVIYDGPTRGACARFPRNVNIHAAYALMGLGFDRTHSTVISDPETKQMRHDIVVKGPGLEWNFMISSTPVGEVTGNYTPESAASTVGRVIGADYDIVMA
jgi:aspartate dehydrogenase